MAEKQKTGWYRAGSAFLWASSLAAFGWWNEGILAGIGAGFAGLFTGWSTASLLGWVARLGGGWKIMMGAGLILGVLLASGSVFGLNLVVILLFPDWFVFDSDTLWGFLLSSAVLPAIVLGILTGLYVRSRIPTASE